MSCVWNRPDQKGGESVKNGYVPPATFIVAKVTNITSGRRRYAVTVAEGIERSITFSLNREVWQDDRWSAQPAAEF